MQKPAECLIEPSREIRPAAAGLTRQWTLRMITQALADSTIVVSHKRNFELR